MAAPSQRRALGALFVVLALAFFGIAAAAAAGAASTAGRVVITAAALAVGSWLATLAWRALHR